MRSLQKLVIFRLFGGDSYAENANIKDEQIRLQNKIIKILETQKK